MLMSDPLLTFRPMSERDLPAVVALEAASQFTPWTAGNFHDALLAGNLCLVANHSRVIVASAVLQMAAANAELLSMAVTPALRRQGVGRRLLDELIARALAFRAESIWLEVRVSNLAAIALYSTAGFVEVGRRKGYYLTTDGREDALMMRLALRLRREGQH
ncbi:MAG: ribosomal protein S18-alanine N-acetyltransferase [Betaproteobacteria bacterium]